MTWFKCGNGGTSTERLLFVQYKEEYNIRIPAIDFKTEDSSFDEYLTYNSSTNQFEVIKPFWGLVVAWVRQYKSPSSNVPKGEFRINGASYRRYASPGTDLNMKGGICFVYDFETGDTFSSYCFIDHGYPQQFFKIYITDMEAKTMEFVNEDTE